ncbi:hypothetical protein GCM10010269_66140 [Streptomyces humidus]|uniref:Uncharacterized protein n=1 Tax=Streptomyces humidus TaxID=52259 RepID=A0A918G403_9ACTN|nr:hypothetical protein GCM10010269_66140 [Streptomyces humidus]
MSPAAVEPVEPQWGPCSAGADPHAHRPAAAAGQFTPDDSRHSVASVTSPVTAGSGSRFHNDR